MTNNMSALYKVKRDKYLEQINILLATNAWNEELFKLAEEKCKFVKNYHRILFPGQYLEIVIALEEWQNQEMLKILVNLEKPAKIREQLALALEIRIMQVASKEAHITQDSFFTIPSNIIYGKKAAFHTCDLIWRYAGDQSTDFNYYTKRGLLLPVYLAAKLFYFSDRSIDHIKTKEFIASSLNTIINIASYKRYLKLPKMEDIPILRLFT